MRRRPPSAGIAAGTVGLVAFAAAAVGAGLGRGVLTTYLPVLLERIGSSPGLIGTLLLVNAAAGFAVPLAVGLWSDRRRARGLGRSVPFMLGGSLLAGGGLVAVALGSASSYAALALFALVAYAGLNAVTTAHRTLVAEAVDAAGRPRATGAQELATLVGGLVGVAAGGALVEVAGWAPFALAAPLLPALALPTLLRARGREPGADGDVVRRTPVRRLLRRALARPGVAALLGAQVLWVLGYAALPAFFILYADAELGMRPSVAALWLVGFGVLTGASMLATGRVRDPRRHRPVLLGGVALLGGGMALVASTGALPVVAVGLAAAAVGFGVVSAIGFPVFAELIPDGEAGGYTALYFSVRAIASAVALPLVGWSISATGSYRAMFVLGGAATLAALVPLTRLPGAAPAARRAPGPLAPALRRLGAACTVLVAVGTVAAVLSSTVLERLDVALFRLVNGLGPWPDPVFATLNPHLRNYATLVVVGMLAAAVSGAPLRAAALLVGASWLLSYVLARAITVLWDRPRPEEVAIARDGSFQGYWEPFSSFPSGHAAVTAALTVSLATVMPRLRVPLLGYLGPILLSRVVFGAHFPLDVLAGAALGYASVRSVATFMAAVGATPFPPLIRARPGAPGPNPAPAGTSFAGHRRSPGSAPTRP